MVARPNEFPALAVDEAVKDEAQDHEWKEGQRLLKGQWLIHLLKGSSLVHLLKG
jgi:hypothetical protein